VVSLKDALRCPASHVHMPLLLDTQYTVEVTTALSVSALSAFAVTEGPDKPRNKDPETVKDTGGPDTSLSETYDRKGNTIFYDRDTPGGGDRQDTTCTKQEYWANDNECPRN
jgi:hypothetical protein